MNEFLKTHVLDKLSETEKTEYESKKNKKDKDAYLKQKIEALRIEIEKHLVKLMPIAQR
jgi:hypothetical protein